MIKADEVEYEPTFYDWMHGEWVHPKVLKRNGTLGLVVIMLLAKRKKQLIKRLRNYTIKDL